MATRELGAEPPEPLRRAFAGLWSATLRPEVTISELPAPRRLAPYAAAVSGEVGADGGTSGRLVVLVDPAGQQAWGGSLRLVAFVRTCLEPEMARDPLLPAVAWSWLVEALAAHSVAYAAAGGTVTRVLSERFGALTAASGGDGEQGEVELRASWTGLSPPAGDDALHDHIAAWSDLLCVAGGLPPVPPGVVPIAARPRARRGAG